jgi:hypothetical protein
MNNNELDKLAIEQDEEATVQRLAKLTTLKYAKERIGAAQELGIPVTKLDKAVTRPRTQQPIRRDKVAH